MLKIMGCLLILVGAGGFGTSTGLQMRSHLEQLVELKEVIYTLLCEMKYYKKPLAEAFLAAAKNGGGNLGKVFSLIAERMKNFEDAKGSAIWEESFLKYREDFLFSGEEFDIILKTGHFLDAPDMETKQRELELYEGQINRKIEEIQNGMGEKRRVCMYGSVFGGLFLIILLI